MDKKHARFILLSHQSGLDAAPDPQMADALREVEGDPELASWLEKESAFDEALRARLSKVEPPQGLKEAVLASTPETVPAPSGSRWMPLACAAALALLATVAAVWLWPQGPESTFAAFRSEMVEVAASPIRFDYASTDPRALQRWLNTRTGTGSLTLPEAMKSLSGLGCREFKWRGHSVALLCFRVGEGQALHVFVLPRGALADAPEEGPARFTASGERHTAAWRQGETMYVATLRGEEAALRRHLGLASF